MKKLYKLILLLQTTYIQCIRLYHVGDFYPAGGESNPVTSESKTSGPIRDVIKRNSPRYRKVLIRNTNNEVFFNNEDARYMTSRTKSKLDVLATLVKGTGNHIRVIKAWTDQVDTSERLSLHYEGNSFPSLSHLRAMFPSCRCQSINLLCKSIVWFLHDRNTWVKIFKNGPSKICGKQPLKNLK